MSLSSLMETDPSEKWLALHILKGDTHPTISFRYGDEQSLSHVKKFNIFESAFTNTHVCYRE